MENRMTPSLLPRVRLARAIIETIQRETLRLTLDTQECEQIARLGGASDRANTLGVSACELGEAHKALAAAIGCLDDGMTGLECVAAQEAHPGASGEEIEAILQGLTR
jgi:hypothetical protein